jgi:NAD(P)H-hydrate epimerase
MCMKKINFDDLSFVTRAQMMEVDRLMTETYSINLMQMMENAGRNLADLTQHVLGGDLSEKNIAVVCGGGSNGGGGLAAARHLINRGVNVCVALAVDKSELRSVPAQQLHALSRMGAIIVEDFPKGEYDLFIDALIGYGLHGAPRGRIAAWIALINQQQSKVLSLDIPSGMDADTGLAEGVCVEAWATMTLALPKTGMLDEKARRKLGELYLADISVPARLLHSLGMEMQVLFDEGAIIKIEVSAN